MSESTLPTLPVDDAPETGSPRAPGGTIGRFVIVGSLGVGGMGVVLKAFDPDLDRAVAIKLLRPDSSAAEDRAARERLKREAQIMARVTHPNVVGVFEVGEAYGQTFVVMEYVHGPTLKRWLAAKERSVKEILDAAISAGRGLSAAHAEGLVHRDVKPSNVLVGADGRPRIGDFGIARAVAPTADGAGPASRGGVDTDRIRSGTADRAGTIGYMAPEHLAGEALDARADQFSFCVMVFEALHGELPFSAGSLADYRAALDGRPKKPVRADVPAHVSAALARGLSRDPAARWPSMDDLLDALSRDPRAALRRRLSVGGAALIVAGGLAAALVSRRADPAPQCASADGLLQGIWDEPSQKAVERAFLDTKLSFAADTFARVKAEVDGYTKAWKGMHEEACRATRVEGRQSDSLYDLRMACLDRGRKKLALVTAEWAKASPGTVVRALDLAGSLPPVQACADTAALTEVAPMPEDPAARTKILDLRARLDAAAVKVDADPTSGTEPEKAIVEEALATSYAPLVAEAQHEYGVTLRRRGQPGAIEQLQSAAKSAAKAHDDGLSAKAYSDLARALSIDEGKLPEALLAAEAAEAFLARSSGAPAVRARVLGAKAEVLRLLDRLDQAREAEEEAYRLQQENHLEGGAQILNALAILASQQGRAAEAASYSERAVKAVEERYGPDHPAVAQGVNTLGYVFAQMGDFARAEPLFLRSLAIAEKSVPLDAPEALILRTNVACIRLVRGHFEEAATLFDQTLRLCESSGKSDSLEASEALVNFAELRRLHGEMDKAEALLQKALAIREKKLGPRHSELILPLHVLAHVRMNQGRLGDAEALLGRALSIAKEGGEASQPYLELRVREAELLRAQKKADKAREQLASLLGPLEKAVGKNHPLLVEVAVQWARSDSDVSTHVQRLTRAVEIADAQGLDPLSTGAARAWLARALAAAGDARAAEAAADRAEKDLSAAAKLPEAVKELEELRAHRKRALQNPPSPR